MRRLLASCLLFLAFAGDSSAAKPKETMRTVTRKGYTTFKVPKEWRVAEDWKSDTPNALVEFVDAEAGPIQLQVIFFPTGNKQYADREAWMAQAMKPNVEFEKTVSTSAVTLDGRPATLVHVELLDMLWVTARFGQKRKVIKDLVEADYPGGWVVVSFSSPEKVYEARRKDLARFMSTFKLLVPKAKPKPAVTESSTTVPSPQKP